MNGDGDDKPRGFLDHDTVDNAVWTWGNLGYVPSGVDGGIGDGDDFVVFADAVETGETGSAVNKFDVARIALDPDNRVSATEFITCRKARSGKCPVARFGDTEEAVFLRSGRNNLSGHAALGVYAGGVGNPYGALAQIFYGAQE